MTNNSEDKEYYVNSSDIRIIKAILSDRKNLEEFSSSFDENIFLSTPSKNLGKLILSFFKKFKTAPSPRIILEEINNNKDLHDEISFVFSEIDKIKYDSSEFKYDLEKLKNSYIIQKGISLKESLTQKDVLTTNDVISYLEEFKKLNTSIEKIRNPEKSVYTQITLKDYLSEFKANYNEKFNHPELRRGYLTQYKYIDHITNGFSKNDLIIFAGETGAGKSIILNNLALQMWKGTNSLSQTSNFSRGLNVLYFSLEMSYDQCLNRSLAALADVPQYGLRDATLNKSEMLALKQSADFINNYPYHFEVVDVPRGLSVDGLEERFNSALERFKPEIVVVDYLGLLDEPNFSGDDWLKLGVIAGKLHEFARAYGICCITATQMNRKNKSSQDSDIGIHRIGRSSLILHHAVLGIIIENREDEYTYSDMKLHIVKNRNGALGSFTLDKNLSHGRLSDPEMVILPETSSRIYLPHEQADISGLLAQIGWT